MTDDEVEAAVRAFFEDDRPLPAGLDLKRASLILLRLLDRAREESFDLFCRLDEAEFLC